MGKRLLFMIILANCLSLYLPAQEIGLTGIIRNSEDRKPLLNVNILIRSKDTNKIIGFDISKATGKFQMKLQADKSVNATISFSYIGFETIVQELSGHDQEFEIMLRPTAINIKEVQVKAPKIRAQGDTLVYNVAAYAKEYDKTIGDVLKKLPGIEVKESGQIFFNGTSINKFYIEGSDLLGGKYGIATNSISSKDISTVEVLQEHQPVRALEGLAFSDNAAINLKLKEEAKYRWVGSAQAGTGFTPLLWDVRLIAMRFTKKWQTLNTYKANNTGMDITREFATFDFKEMKNKLNYLPDYIAASPPSSLGLSRKRELFNRTHQLTTNNLTKLKNDFELKMNSTYMNHRETGDRLTETVYYEPEGETTLISSDESSRFHRNDLTVSLVLEGNKPTYNLTNKLSGDFSWIDRRNTVSGSYPNRQEISSPHHRISNDLYMLKRYGGNFATFDSYVLFQHHPQELTVARSSSSQIQHIRQSGFFTDNKAGYGFTLGEFVTTFTAGVAVMQRTLDTRLEGVNAGGMNGTNDTRFGYVHSYVTPNIEYQYYGLRATISLPLNYYTYNYKDRSVNEKTGYNVLLLTPSLLVRMNLTPRITLSVSGETGKSGINERLFYPAAILNDYRSLSTGFPAFKQGVRQSVSGGLTYKRPLNALFSGVSVIRSWNKVPYTLDQSFAEEYIVSSYTSDVSKSRSWILSGFFNKGLDSLNGYFFLNVLYSRSDGLLVRNNVPLPNSRTDLMVTPKIETHFVKWLVLNYALNYNRVTMSLGHTSDKEASYNISQSVLIRLLPFPKWNISLRGEHYYNKISDTRKKHFVLADMDVSYKIGKKTELTLNMANLLNQKEYSYISFSDEVSNIRRSYRIRPRNILLSAYFIF